MREHKMQSVSEVEPTINLIADNCAYNPVIRWIESKPWDQTIRLGALLASVKVGHNHGFKDSFITKWLIMAVAALYEPNGIEAPGMLVFQGKQHRGKTLWFQSLFPDPIDIYVKTGISFNPSNRDSCMTVITNWAVELGELDATFRKSDIAALKSFISDRSDVWRLSYAKREKRFARRTVLYASVNDEQFLSDATGNRRFWTVPIESCNEKHGIDMQQLWAEIMEMYKAGYGWKLSSSEVEAIEEVNKDFLAIEPVEDILGSRYDWGTLIYNRWISATDIAKECEIKNTSKADSNKIAHYIKKMNGGQKKNGRFTALFAVPDLVNSLVGRTRSDKWEL
jgi:putative DNA primase/helicase